MTTTSELKTEENRVKTILVISVIIAAILLVFAPAKAATITMSNPSGIAERDVIVYSSNGTTIGLYNSTSVITTEDGVSYIFQLAPMRTNVLEDPADWLLNEAFPFVQSNVLVLIVLFVLAAIWRGR